MFMGRTSLSNLRERDGRLLVARDRQLRRKLAGGGTECFGCRRIAFADRNRHTRIAADADRLVDGHAAEEWNRELAREGLAAPLAEDVALVTAVRTDEVAHVFDEPQRRHVQLLIHP